MLGSAAVSLMMHCMCRVRSSGTTKVLRGNTRFSFRFYLHNCFSTSFSSPFWLPVSSLSNRPGFCTLLLTNTYSRNPESIQIPGKGQRSKTFVTWNLLLRASESWVSCTFGCFYVTKTDSNLWLCWAVDSYCTPLSVGWRGNQYFWEIPKAIFSIHCFIQT